MSDDNNQYVVQDNTSEKLGMIQVKRLEENEDGSATLEIETNREATRFLVEIGLTRLLEMAIDKDNHEYKIEEDLLKTPKGTVQQELE